VLGGKDADHLEQVASHAWNGLETAMQLDSAPKAVAVRAVDAEGRTLGVSATVGG
jgi:hypothetical protein